MFVCVCTAKYNRNSVNIGQVQHCGVCVVRLESKRVEVGVVDGCEVFLCGETEICVPSETCN